MCNRLCCSKSDLRVESVSELNLLSYGSNKQVCAPSHFDKTWIVVYTFGLRMIRKGRSILGLHNLFSHTETILLSKSCHACPNKSAISLGVLKGKKFCFSLMIFGLLILLSKCLLSFSLKNSANTIFWTKVAFTYGAQVSL